MMEDKQDLGGTLHLSHALCACGFNRGLTLKFSLSVQLHFIRILTCLKSMLLTISNGTYPNTRPIS